MENPLGTGLTITVVGLLVVFAVQIAITLVVTLLGKLDARWQQREEQVEVERLEKDPTIDATTAVLLSAAVATLIQGRHRIRSVRLLPTPVSSSAWSSTGRAVLQGSHVLTRKNR